jgi:hypothetical protein
VEHLKDISLR